MELSHVGIWTMNMEETEKFYRDILGLGEKSSYQVSSEIMGAIFGTDSPCRVKVYGLDHGGIEVFPAPKGVEPGINHFALAVQDKRRFCEEAASKGGRVIQVWKEDHPVYFIKEPSGILIEIRE